MFVPGLSVWAPALQASDRGSFGDGLKHEEEDAMANPDAETMGEQLGCWLVQNRALLASLDPELLQTLWGLALHADASGCVALSQSVLAEALGVSRNAVAARLARLLAFRWQGRALVERVTVPAFHVPVYRVVIAGVPVAGDQVYRRRGPDSNTTRPQGPRSQAPSELGHSAQVPSLSVPSVLGATEPAAVSGLPVPEADSMPPEVP